MWSDSFLDMQRFQVPYNLKEIPEVQEYLNGAFENAKHHGDLQDLYRRRFVSISATSCALLNTRTACLSNPNNPLIYHPGRRLTICDNCSVGRHVHSHSSNHWCSNSLFSCIGPFLNISMPFDFRDLTFYLMIIAHFPSQSTASSFIYLLSVSICLFACLYEPQLEHLNNHSNVSASPW